MKKIMFNDKYGLTIAVLEGRKTMTRRIIPSMPAIIERDKNDYGNKVFHKVRKPYIDKNILKLEYENGSIYIAPSHCQPKFKVGEIVAIAQSYNVVKQDMEILYYGRKATNKQEFIYNCLINMPYDHKGWGNKMFVNANYMPNHIRITDIKVERLKDISREDCMKEGILNKNSGNHIHKRAYPFCFAGGKHVWDNSYSTPRQAFAALIDKVSGKGTWDSNPLVFAYSFEKID